MKLQLLYSLTIFFLAFEPSHAAISPEVYWKVKLPNTQMPLVIKDFLPHAEAEVRERKQDKSDTEETVYYGLHKPITAFAWHRAATEAEVRELKYKSDTAEKVYYGLHKPITAFAWHRAATEAEVRELKRDKSDTSEKVYYGLHKPITAFAWHRAATEAEVRELKRDRSDTEKVFYGLHKPLSAFAWHRAATEAEIRELKRDKSDTSEKVYYGLHKPITAFAWHHAATEAEVRELKDKSDTTQKVYNGLHKPLSAFAWHRAATDDEVRELKQDKKDTIDECHDAKTDVKETYLYKPFFLEKDLEKGNVINFFSLKNKNEAPFLPRQLAESIPFSLNKIPEILNHFSIESNSKDAEAIEETIKLCEEPEIKHKEKHTCATSLESMVDFSISALGTNHIMANTTKVEGETQKLQEYTIENVKHISEGDNMVCHKLSYAYAVHYCHIGGGTKTFMVSLVGVDGTKVKAATVCHKDTSFWNPKGLPFVVLNVKPGTTSICHFLRDDQILFVPVKEASRYAI